MTDDSLFGKAQSLLDALREKGLHLPNPARVDDAGDALGALASEVRALAADASIALDASFTDDGHLDVHVVGRDAHAVAIVEARAFAPWREAPSVAQARVRGAFARIEAIDRDGPVNLVARDGSGVPLAWRTLGARG